MRSNKIKIGVLVTIIVILIIADVLNIFHKTGLNSIVWGTIFGSVIAVSGTLYITRYTIEKQLEAQHQNYDKEIIIKLTESKAIAPYFIYVLHKEIFQFNYKEEYFNIDSVLPKFGREDLVGKLYKNVKFDKENGKCSIDVHKILFIKKGKLMRELYKPIVDFRIIESFLQSELYNRKFERILNHFEEIKDSKFHNKSMIDDMCGQINYTSIKKVAINMEYKYNKNDQNNDNIEYINVKIDSKDFYAFEKYFENLPISYAIRDIYYNNIEEPIKEKERV